MHATAAKEITSSLILEVQSFLYIYTGRHLIQGKANAEDHKAHCHAERQWCMEVRNVSHKDSHSLRDVEYGMREGTDVLQYYYRSNVVGGVQHCRNHTSIQPNHKRNFGDHQLYNQHGCKNKGAIDRDYSVVLKAVLPRIIRQQFLQEDVSYRKCNV